MSHIEGLRAVSLRPNEILVGKVSISFDTRQVMDPDGARRSVGVRDANGIVRLRNRGKRAVWTPAESLKPGNHVFAVEGIISSTGRKISGGGQIPFSVVQTRARVPTTVAVESMVRLRRGRLGLAPLPLFQSARGRYVEVLKGENRRTRKPVELAFDQTGRKIDIDGLRKSIVAARVQTFGKLHEDLHAQLGSGRASDMVHVVVWFKTDARSFDVERPVRGEMTRPRRALAVQRRALAGATRLGARVIRDKGGRDIEISRLAPFVSTKVRKDAVRELAARDDVAGVFPYDPTGVEDLEDSMAIANSDDVHALGVRGAGVKVAVWERGPDSTANLSITARFTNNPSTSDHSRHVHGIIKNTKSGDPRGHARSCSLHSANSTSLNALEWAVRDKECTVINQSFHRSAEPKQGTLSFDDVYKDWLAITWPYPTICQAAGNFWSTDPDNISPPSSEFVNHKGFNSLAVGNHNDAASAMSTSSVFRNPTSSHGDRELPEISANGTFVDAVNLTKSGTSMASPAVAGVAALVQSTDTTLKHWPEGCRAILLAGATRNVTDDTWWKDVASNNDARDGSGAVNALESHRIAQSRRSRNASATRRGWDVGSLRTSDFNSSTRQSTFSYKVKVPSGFFGPRKVKVALAWTSEVNVLSVFGITIPLTSQLTVDLDLKIFDSAGNQVGYSGSWDNSYEIAEFTGAPGATYTIRIRRWSGTDRVWYGIGWTVTGGLQIIRRLAGGTLLTGTRLSNAVTDLAG